MAIVFQGEVGGISDVQLEFIKNVLQDSGYKNGQVVISNVGKIDDNYSASVKRITIRNVNETFKMIAKIAPQNEMIRFLSNTVTLFKNEDIMYTKVLSKFDELQKSAGIPENERYRFPVCYGSLYEPMHEIILLEDLDVLNFAMLDRFQSLSDECVRLALKNFAIFHSLSYALKKQEPETYAAMKSGLSDIWAMVTQIPDTEKHFLQLENTTMEIVAEEKYKRVVKGAVGKATELSAKFTRADTDGKHSIIQHGDSWTNNIMYRFEGKNPVQSCFIDYQISKESNPVCDLLYMIFNCTDYEMRKKHFHDWIDYYHTELDKSLHNYGLKANFVYPKNQLDVDLKRYGKVMFGLSVILASVLIRKSEDAAKIKEFMEGGISADMSDLFEMTALDLESVTLYKKRIEGLIDSILEFDLL